MTTMHTLEGHRSIDTKQPRCRGESCQQGHKPCRERCGAEMGCTTGEDQAAGQSWLLILAVAGIVVASVLAWLTPLFD